MCTEDSRLFTIKKQLSKYIQKTTRVFSEMKLSHDMKYINSEKTGEVIDAAKRYLEDAKYYYNQKRFETGLISVAYGEGLLDALRILGIAEFKW